MDGSMGFESFMKIGDLIKIDYAGWAIAEESEHFYDVSFHGIIIDKYTGGYHKREYIIVYTTDGEHKTFTTEKDIPPTITVVSTENH